MPCQPAYVHSGKGVQSITATGKDWLLPPACGRLPSWLPPACLCPPGAVYWSVTVFYQMGAGDFGPATLAEVIFTMVYIAINILLWAWIIGSISLLVARADEAAAKYRHRMHALERYGADQCLPQVKPRT